LDEVARFVTNWQEQVNKTTEKLNTATEKQGEMAEKRIAWEHGTIFVHYYNVRNVRTYLRVI